MANEPMETGEIVAEYRKTVVIVGQCNCPTCRRQRMDENIHKLLLMAYPALPFVPRNRDPLIRYNGYEQDAIYEGGEKALRLTCANLKRLRTKNKLIRKSIKRMDRLNWVYCWDCGALHKADKKRRYKDHHFCEVCFLLYAICTDCGDLHQKRSSSPIWKSKAIWRKFYHNDSHGRPEEGEHYRSVCKSCRTKTYAACKRCGFMDVKDKFVRCIHYRDESGELIYNSMCKECAKEYKTKCSKCGKVTFTNIGENAGRKHFCPVCTEERVGMHPHTYKPIMQKFQVSTTEGSVDTDKDLFFGFELEVESYESHIQDRSAMSYMVKDHVGTDYCYIVHDGTMRNGIELVSHPFTWEKYKREDVPVWDDMLSYFRKYDWKSNLPACGMHIHTSKKAWGTFQIYKLLQFFYNPKNKKFIVDIAQRKPNKYCALQKKDFDESVLVAKGKKNRSSDHYSIVNLNNKRGTGATTIEFRMFRGTLEPLYFHKNLEFIHAVYFFTRDYPKGKMTEKSFRTYVNNRAKNYPHLHAFINRGGK